MRDMPKEILRTMGKRLKMLRDDADLDQRQFAHAVSQRGVSVTNSFVSKMESGDSKPSIDVLVAASAQIG
jgi:transcriptional regulator with XRE-family HTH domain